MKRKELHQLTNERTSKKLSRNYESFQNLIGDLRKRELDSEIINTINQEIEIINSFSESNKVLLKQLRKSKAKILEMIEKKLKLIPKYHYQNKWTALGMLAGVLFSTLFSQLGFSDTWNSLGMGISMGLLFGMLAGKNRDEKANREGFQLNI